MTNEQLTQNVMDLMAYKAKAEEEHGMFKSMWQNMRDDIKKTNALAEDIHIMAINMQNMQKSLENMQKSQEETNKKVNALSSKEFVEYEENKKLVKQNIISKVTTVAVTLILNVIAFLFGLFMNK